MASAWHGSAMARGTAEFALVFASEVDWCGTSMAGGIAWPWPLRTWRGTATWHVNGNGCPLTWRCQEHGTARQYRKVAFSFSILWYILEALNNVGFLAKIGVDKDFTLIFSC